MYGSSSGGGAGEDDGENTQYRFGALAANVQQRFSHVYTVVCSKKTSEFISGNIKCKREI